MKYNRKSNLYPLFEQYEALRQPRYMQILGWSLVVLGVVLTAGAFGSPDGAGLAAVLVLGLGLLGIGVVAVVFTRNWALEFHRDEIVQRTLNNKTIQIRFNQVVRHAVVRTMYENSLVLYGPNKTSIRINTIMVNPDVIIQEIERQQGRL